MTAADVATWLPALATIEKRARLLGTGFGVEVALVGPLVGGVVGPELLVSVPLSRWQVATLTIVAPSVWFTIAGLAALAGCVLLVSDHSRRADHGRERRRWAALRGWGFVEADPVLPGRWRHGVIARGGGGGQGRDLVSGRLFTTGGRRQVYVFDHVQGAAVDTVVVAVQRREAQAGVVVELWLPSVSFPRDAGLDLLGPVGVRYGFVHDVAAARPMLTPELVRACDDLGADIPVAWLEQDWVLAAAPVGSTPARLEHLLRALGEIADQLDAPGGNGPSADPTAADARS